MNQQDILTKKSALHEAVLEHDYECCKVLIENGANIHLKNANGQTPFELSKFEGLFEVYGLCFYLD